MPFWTDNNFEPKQDHQFKVIFVVGSYNYEIGWHYIMSCDKPSYQIGEKSYKLINKQLKYPTNITWSDINMELVDTTDNRVLAFLDYLHNLQNKNIQLDCPYNSPEKAAIGKMLVEIQTLNKEGVPVEKWTLMGSWIKTIKQTQINYTNENISKITLTLSYDWAQVEFSSIPSDVPVAPPPRTLGESTAPSAASSSPTNPVERRATGAGQGPPRPLSFNVDIQPDQQPEYATNLSRDQAQAEARQRGRTRRILGVTTPFVTALDNSATVD